MNIYSDRQKFAWSVFATFAIMFFVIGCHSSPLHSAMPVRSAPAGDEVSKNSVSNEEDVKAAKCYVDGDLAGATKHSREALRHDPTNAMLKYMLAVSLKREKKFREAIPLFREASLSDDKAVSHAAKIELAYLEKQTR